MASWPSARVSAVCAQRYLNTEDILNQWIRLHPHQYLFGKLFENSTSNNQIFYYNDDYIQNKVVLGPFHFTMS